MAAQEVMKRLLRYEILLQEEHVLTARRLQGLQQVVQEVMKVLPYETLPQEHEVMKVRRR